MQIAIGLYPGFTALDAIGPYAVFTSVPGADIVVCADRKGMLADESDLLHLDLAHSIRCDGFFPAGNHEAVALRGPGGTSRTLFRGPGQGPAQQSVHGCADTAILRFGERLCHAI